VSTQAVWDSLNHSNAIEVINAETILNRIICDENAHQELVITNDKK
jgi:hypothetical protein